ncbi:hypothetical protein [Celeribacter baekdonensis]|jgi:hypothetical protein|uniref:Uncharacterized protein n=1 Tax=Celeribacter baekdonensis TaxID=875171 RepID=A0A2R4M095_9RHOB|nr:hypothetical protein [Celeribacter baekdonensis]AVW90620.1 hypothetical protein DA792_05540 [Celeribacter baekdonensis]|tara:strand:+ start:21616 stop:22059 length:444 start_codon:yes stop_codon:yes gene_type:complete
MKLPFWDRLSENGKQALAIIAVLQAAHFVITVPLGYIEQRKWAKQFETDEPWYPRALLVENDIFADLWKAQVMIGRNYVYREECEADQDGEFEFIHSWQEPVDCTNLPSLEAYVADKLALHKVPQDQIDSVRLGLRVLGGLPLEDTE